jgi:hypothetical protein
MIFVTRSIGPSIKEFLSIDISIYVESFTTTYVLWMIISSDRTADYNMNLHTAIEYGFSSGSRPWLTTHMWGRNMHVWGKCVVLYIEVLIPMDTLIHVMIKIQLSHLDSLDHHKYRLSMDILVLVHVVIEF